MKKGNLVIYILIALSLSSCSLNTSYIRTIKINDSLLGDSILSNDTLIYNSKYGLHYNYTVDSVKRVLVYSESLNKQKSDSLFYEEIADNWMESVDTLAISKSRILDSIYDGANSLYALHTLERVDTIRSTFMKLYKNRKGVYFVNHDEKNFVFTFSKDSVECYSTLSNIRKNCGEYIKDSVLSVNNASFKCFVHGVFARNYKGSRANLMSFPSDDAPFSITFYEKKNLVPVLTEFYTYVIKDNQVNTTVVIETLHKMNKKRIVFNGKYKNRLDSKKSTNNGIGW
jgi:hypothetical protein